MIMILINGENSNNNKKKNEQKRQKKQKIRNLGECTREHDEKHTYTHTRTHEYTHTSSHDTTLVEKKRRSGPFRRALLTLTNANTGGSRIGRLSMLCSCLYDPLGCSSEEETYRIEGNKWASRLMILMGRRLIFERLNGRELDTNCREEFRQCLRWSATR